MITSASGSISWLESSFELLLTVILVELMSSGSICSGHVEFSPNCPECQRGTDLTNGRSLEQAESYRLM